MIKQKDDTQDQAQARMAKITNLKSKREIPHGTKAKPCQQVTMAVTQETSLLCTFRKATKQCD
jgi:hypothetical protein